MAPWLQRLRAMHAPVLRLRRTAVLALALCTPACGSFAAQDVEVSGEASTTSRPIPWSVSRHVWPSSGPGDDALLAKDLDLVAELGARLVRTDLWWYAIEPERGRFDAAALASYSRTLDEARARGLEVLVILSGAPGWARKLWETGSRDAFVEEFQRYATEVARMAGTRVRYYQLWNEPNHVIDFVDGEGDVRLFRAGRAGITAGLAAAGRPNHRTTTILNVLVDGHDSPVGPSWMTDVDFYMERAKDAIDVIGIDHYPGTWSVGDWGGNVLDRLGALGRRWGKAVAVLETGLSTTPCTMPWNTEAAQAAWVREQLPRIRAKARALEQSGVRFELVNWFKLEDRETSDCFDPEDHFGVVRTDRSKKPAFDALREQIASFAE